MIRYTGRRLLKGLVIFFITVTVTFLILRLMPSDPVALLLDNRMTIEQREALLKEFGLDKPLHEQYFLYIKNLLHGNLGMSFKEHRPVSAMIADKLPWTLLLMITTQILTLSIGIPLGIYSGYRRGTFFDQAVNAVSIVGISIFVPWLGFSFMYLFGVQLNILKIGGAVTPGLEFSLAYIIDVIKRMIMPVLTLMIIYLANYVLYTRGSIIEVLNEDYIRTARSKGMKENRVLWGHAAKNAMIPTVTSAGIMLGNMVAGAILTETVYAYPGVGRMIYDSVMSQDYPALQGAFIVLALSVILMNIIIDLICAWLDPRIKLEEK